MTSLVSWREIVVHRLSVEFTKLVSPEIPIAEASNAPQRRVTAFDSAQLCCSSALEGMTPKDRSLLGYIAKYGNPSLKMRRISSFFVVVFLTGLPYMAIQSKNASDFLFFVFHPSENRKVAQ